jgi:hypothetical protein
MIEGRWSKISGIAMTLMSFDPTVGVAADVTTTLVAETAPNYWQVPAFLSNASGPTSIVSLPYPTMVGGVPPKFFRIKVSSL